ncbi:hypothetical protein QFC24_006661 [Naganishia onofrii]|uniref:Uncharacterized protein n=1 Tax=Naganishia onofrii TaxID=1851511 RepID=A0ACC2WYA4_9TREE|nr:hypothetical protein QFC24_006661 [Naganishia onofrii]
MGLLKAFKQVDTSKEGNNNTGPAGDAADKQQEEEGEEEYDDMDDDEGERWGGFQGRETPEAEDDGVARKVEFHEASMAQIAQGMQAVTTIVKRGFQELAGGRRKNDAPLSNTYRGTSRAQHTPHVGDNGGGYDSDMDSFVLTGGKSDWEDLTARLNTAGRKEMRTIAQGEIMPERIYLCIPRDSDLFPQVTEEVKEKVRWDEEGPCLEKKDSAPYDKTKVFRKPTKAVTSPMHSPACVALVDDTRQLPLQGRFLDSCHDVVWIRGYPVRWFIQVGGMLKGLRQFGSTHLHR